jgi:hypothetical protein
MFFASVGVPVGSRFDVLEMLFFFNLLDIDQAAACDIVCHFGWPFVSAAFCWLLLASVWSPQLCLNIHKKAFLQRIFLGWGSATKGLGGRL